MLAEALALTREVDVVVQPRPVRAQREIEVLVPVPEERRRGGAGPAAVPPHGCAHVLGEGEVCAGVNVGDEALVVTGVRVPHFAHPVAVVHHDRPHGRAAHVQKPRCEDVIRGDERCALCLRLDLPHERPVCH